MRTSIPLLAAAILALAACSDQDDRTTSSVQQPAEATDIDADPTPDTGTGGASQTTSPDGTLNSAPGQPPAAR